MGCSAFSAYHVGPISNIMHTSTNTLTFKKERSFWVKLSNNRVWLGCNVGLLSQCLATWVARVQTRYLNYHDACGVFSAVPVAVLAVTRLIKCYRYTRL